MTAADLINSSARLIGTLASGEVLTNTEAQDALSSLNQLLDTWSTESLLIYSLIEDDLTLVGSQQSYQMGTGAADFNTARPLKIENAFLRTVNGSTNYDIPLEIINDDQWANIGVKNVSSAIPLKLYVKYTYPNATLQFWPLPSGSKTLVLFSWKPLSSFTSLTTTVSLPPGYVRALRYALAIEIAPEYGRSLDPVVIAMAEESKAAIKRMNNKPLYLSTDDALSGGRAGFNWLTGQ